MSVPEYNIAIKVPKDNAGCLRCHTLDLAQRMQGCDICTGECDFGDNFSDCSAFEECMKQAESKKGKEKIPKSASLEPVDVKELIDISEEDLDI